MHYVTSLLFWMILLGCISCQSNYHLKRARYHIAMAQAKGSQFHSDTLFKTIEIPIPEIHKDTIFKSGVGDTVVIEKDKLKIVYVKLKGDSVFIEGECKADTIYKEVITKVNQSICPPQKEFKWWWLLIAAGVGALVILIVRKLLF
jgi:hypothetical protein